MKNGFSKVLSCLCVALVVALAAAFLPACLVEDKTELDPEKAKSHITMTSTVTSDKIQLNMTSDRKEVGSSTVKVVAVKAYQYLEGDTFSGVSEDIVQLSDVEPYVVGKYRLGTESEISLERFSDASGGYDGLYNKYYLVNENDVVKGPVYSTKIEAKYDSVPELSNKSKKGLLAEYNGFSAFKDLGASHVVVNFEIKELIRPNEIFEDGEAIELPLPEEDK